MVSSVHRERVASISFPVESPRPNQSATIKFLEERSQNFSTFQEVGFERPSARFGRYTTRSSLVARYNSSYAIRCPSGRFRY